jgi:exonuclease SbcC
MQRGYCVIPTEIEVENFLAYRTPGTLRLDGVHIACLAGPNGAGKSSLLDAITWALWGKARSNSPDDLIHQGARNMQVRLAFDQAGQRYQVIRQRKAGKQGVSGLSLQAWDAQKDAWRDLSAARLVDTQKKIEALLHLDYDTFINSAFLMQGRADEFTKKSPAQRKQVLATILGLSNWEVFETRAKDRIAGTRADMQRLEGRLEEIGRELARRDEYQQSLQAAEAEAKLATEQLAAAESQWAGIQQVRQELVTLQRQIDDRTRRVTSTEREVLEAERELTTLRTRCDRAALQVALEAVRAELGGFDTLQAKLEEIVGKQREAGQEAARLRGANELLGPQTEPIKARAATLESSTEPVCPTCGQALTEDHRHRLLNELQAEIEQRREAYRANQTQLRELDAQVKAMEADRQALDKAVRQRPGRAQQAGELQALLDHAGEAERQSAALAERVARWQAELTADRAERAGLEAQVERSEMQLRAASLTPEAVDRLRLQKRLADERVGGARQQLAALESFARQRTERKIELDRLANDLSLYEDLREAFGKRGVPAMIIETAVPELEASANELLNRMTDGRMHVRIETQKEIKTGEVREALDILISDELGTRAYELYSGGEAFQVNFAIRIALSRLLARRAGAQLRSLFIDEGFGTQDARGREHLVAAINTIQDDFDRILVITHIDELRDAFPARIEVTKTPQGSQFRLS